MNIWYLESSPSGWNLLIGLGLLGVYWGYLLRPAPRFTFFNLGRMAMSAGAFLLFWNPEWVYVERNRPEVTIVLDDSQSMGRPFTQMLKIPFDERTDGSATGSGDSGSGPVKNRITGSKSSADRLRDESMEPLFRFKTPYEQAKWLAGEIQRQIPDFSWRVVPLSDLTNSSIPDQATFPVSPLSFLPNRRILSDAPEEGEYCGRDTLNSSGQNKLDSPPMILITDGINHVTQGKETCSESAETVPTKEQLFQTVQDKNSIQSAKTARISRGAKTRTREGPDRTGTESSPIFVFGLGEYAVPFDVAMERFSCPEFVDPEGEVTLSTEVRIIDDFQNIGQQNIRLEIFQRPMISEQTGEKNGSGERTGDWGESIYTKIIPVADFQNDRDGLFFPFVRTWKPDFSDIGDSGTGAVHAVTETVNTDNTEGGRGLEYLLRVSVDSGSDGNAGRLDLLTGEEPEERETRDLTGVTEWNLVNNQITFQVFSQKSGFRILLIDELPRYEYRYLRELLRRESTVTLKTMLLSADKKQVSNSDGAADPGHLTFGPDLETYRQKDLSEFDVIILGDVDFSRSAFFLSELVQAITRPESQTSLWLIAGEHFFNARNYPEILDPVLPFRRTQNNLDTEKKADSGIRSSGQISGSDNRYPIKETGLATSLRLPSLSQNLTDIPDFSLYWRDSVLEVHPSAGVLAVSDTIPILILQKRGNNSVLWQGTDELWRLNRLENKNFYRQYILSLLFMLRNPERAEMPDNGDGWRFQPGGPAVDITAATGGSDTHPTSGDENDNRIGREISDEKESEFSRLPDSCIEIPSVSAVWRERQFLRFNRAFPEKLAEETGGLFFDLSDRKFFDFQAAISELSKQLSSFSRQTAREIRHPLFSPVWVLLPALFLFLLALFFERKTGPVKK